MASFYAAEVAASTQAYTLSEEESKHCIRVLRKKVGDSIELLNGKGTQLLCRITVDNPKKCSVEIIEVIEHHPESKTIHIAMAPTKNMDRVEWFLEKATELGLTHLTFLKCSNNERNSINLERLHKIAIAAMKQSKRYFLPEITDMQPFSNFIQAHPNGFIGHCYAGEKLRMKEMQNVAPFLIGPEGDFSEMEVDLAKKNGYKAVHLSDNRLRTETAALTAAFSLLNI